MASHAGNRGSIPRGITIIVINSISYKTKKLCDTIRDTIVKMVKNLFLLIDLSIKKPSQIKTRVNAQDIA
jgi:hypothetical protein